MKKHILICGEKGVGKSTLIRRLVEEARLTVGGFCTKMDENAEGAMRPIYIYPASLPTDQRKRGKEKDRMHDELTEVDIRKMQEEIDHRICELRPQLNAEVKSARAFGDLSENYEYKEAKRQRGRNESRIRYLQNMIKTARVVSAETKGDGVGLFDRVTLWLPDDEEEMIVRVVTSLRINADDGLISRKSPLGEAIFGRKIGETVWVEPNPNVRYQVEIRAIEPGEDDESLPIAKY